MYPKQIGVSPTLPPRTPHDRRHKSPTGPSRPLLVTTGAPMYLTANAAQVVQLGCHPPCAGFERIANPRSGWESRLSMSRSHYALCDRLYIQLIDVCLKALSQKRLWSLAHGPHIGPR